jgi:hypothetical protein
MLFLGLIRRSAKGQVFDLGRGTGIQHIHDPLMTRAPRWGDDDRLRGISRDDSLKALLQIRLSWVCGRISRWRAGNTDLTILVDTYFHRHVTAWLAAGQFGGEGRLVLLRSGRNHEEEQEHEENVQHRCDLKSKFAVAYTASHNLF